MIDVVIVIKNNDSTCDIVNPVAALFNNKSSDRVELNHSGVLALDASDEEVLSFIISRSHIDGREYRVVSRDKLPQDRQFRDAWTDDNATETVDVDIAKAHDIKKEILRELRKPILEKLDVEYMKLLEKGEDTSNVIKQKEELRNITKLKLPNNIDELKDFTPDILNTIV